MGRDHEGGCGDVPLPILDIVGGAAVAGCTAWTAWDVYKATKAIPEKLTCALSESVDDCEQQCRALVLRRGEELSRKLALKESGN